MDHYASNVYMILLAIEVVLIFTFTSSDNFTLLFYNLISFVLTYDPVYKTDTPERIISFQKGWYDKTVWISTVSATYLNGTLISSVGKKGENRSDWVLHNQRPVLYLNNQ